MAYAAYRDVLDFMFPNRPLVAAVEWMVLEVTVPSRDALLVRRELLRCAHVEIWRCVPRLDVNLVRLKIKLSSTLNEEVIQRVMLAVPGSEFGAFLPWREHLLRHGLRHGLCHGR